MKLKNILLDYVSLVAVTFVYYLILPAGNFNQFLVAILLEVPIVIIVLLLKKFFQSRKEHK